MIDNRQVLEASEAFGETVEPGDRDAWQPELARAHDLTPLPEIERAMPTLGIFGGLLGRRHVPYKVGIIRELAARSGVRWKMRDISQRVDWLKPNSIHRLVRDLVLGGVLHYEASRGTYRLTAEARVVASFCRALTVSQIKHNRLIKILTAAIRTAQAIGEDDGAVLQPFADAIAILEDDFEEMRALIGDRSEERLKEAVLWARDNVHDMRDLLDHEEEFFGRFQADPIYLDMTDRAHKALTALALLTDEVYIALFEQTDEILRRGLNFDRQDIREMVKFLSIAEVAAVLNDPLCLPAQVHPVDTPTMFMALADYLGRPEVTGGLPEPSVVQVFPPSSPPRNEFFIAKRELEEIAAKGGAPLADWVAEIDWKTAVARMGAAVGAWGRYGPAGTDGLKAVVDPGEGLESVGRAGVALMSPARVRPPEVRS